VCFLNWRELLFGEARTLAQIVGSELGSFSDRSHTGSLISVISRRAFKMPEKGEQKAQACAIAFHEKAGRSQADSPPEFGGYGMFSCDQANRLLHCTVLAFAMLLIPYISDFVSQNKSLAFPEMNVADPM
jgi:hypothetical protein